MRRKTLRSQGEDRVPGRRDQIRIHSAESAEGRPNDRGGERTVNELFPDLMAESAEIRFLLTTAYMGICAVQDFKSRRISLPLTACAGCAAIVLDLPVIAGRGNGVLLMTAGLLPGALLLLLSAAAKGAAGRGDGYCFLILGALCGPKTAWTIAAEALFLASLSGIALMILRKAQRKTRLPFLLFAGAAWAGDTVLRLSGIIW